MGSFYKNAWDEDLITAAIRGDINALHDALLSGADIDAVCSEATHRGKTALMIAAEHDFDTAVSVLLTGKPSVNAQDRFRNTALHHAAPNARGRVIQSLLDAGADPNMRNATGYTALMRAALDGKAENCRILLEAGADLTAKTNGNKELPGKSCIECAAEMERLEVLDLFFKEIDAKKLHKQMVPHVERALEVAQKQQKNGIAARFIYGWMENYQKTVLRDEKKQQMLQRQNNMRRYINRRAP